MATGAANGREIFGNGRGPSTFAFPSRYSFLSLALSHSVSLLKMLLETLRNNTFSRQLQKRAMRKELEEQKRPKQTKTKENFALPIAYLSALRGGRVHCTSSFDGWNGWSGNCNSRRIQLSASVATSGVLNYAQFPFFIVLYPVLKRIREYTHFKAKIWKAMWEKQLSE